MKDLFARVAEILQSLVTHFREVTVFIGGKAIKIMQVVAEVVPQVVRGVGGGLWNTAVAPINALGAIGRAMTSKPQPQQEIQAASDAARDEAIRVTRQKVSNTLEALRTVARAHGGLDEVSPENLKAAEKVLDPAMIAEIRRMRPEDAYQLCMRSSKNLHAYVQGFIERPAGNVVQFPNHVSVARASAYVPCAKVDAQATAAAVPRLWAQDTNGASGLSPAQREAALVAYGRFVERGDAIRVGITDFEEFVTHVQSKAAARNPQGPVRTPDDDLARRFA